MKSSDCDHTAKRSLPANVYDVGGLIVVDDMASDWTPFDPVDLPRIVPCEACGAPLDFGRDTSMRVHRSYLIEQGYADPLDPLGDRQ